MGEIYTLLLSLMLAYFRSLRLTQAFVTHDCYIARHRDTLLQAEKTTLTPETDWQMRLVLKGVSTEKGRKVDEIFVARINFIEDEGYEPPQGSFTQLPPEEGEDAPLLQFDSSRWQLSEDPNDRKDGLWIWGLFEEPLYPFMLLKFSTQPIQLQDDTIGPLQLYAQINHSRKEEAGVVLEPAVLNVRQMESLKADPFGAASVEIFEEVNVGSISIQPVSKDTKISQEASS